MEYVETLVPSIVMAIAFIAVIRVIVRSQGGAQRAKEDAAAEALLASRARRRTSSGE